MKTQQEIRARLDAHRDGGDDFFGFKQEALIDALEFETVADIVNDGVTVADWHTPDVQQSAENYLHLAIDKATGHRGISASRSVEKFTEWLWVLDNGDLARRFEDAKYSPYGAPKLAVLAEAWDVHTRDMEGEVWARMSKGLPCSDDCMEGC